MKAFLRYSLMRFLIFALALVLLYLAGMGGWLLVLVAALVSMAISYIVLRPMREELSTVISEHAERRVKAADDDEAAEDAAVDNTLSADAEKPAVAEKPGAEKPGAEKPVKDAGPAKGKD